MDLQPSAPRLVFLSQLLLLVSLVIKPMHYRWILFLLLLLINSYGYFFVPMDMALKSSFVMWTFTASDYILLTDVQRELALVGQRDPIWKAPFWERLKWGSKLLISTRGVGWKHEPAAPIIPSHPPQSMSRISFILAQLKKSFICFLIYDLCANFILMRNPASSGEGKIKFGDLPLIDRYTGVLGIAVGGCIGINLPYIWISIAMVALQLSDPSEWPDLFGNWGDAYTVRKFWGRVWHQGFRRIVSSHGRFLARRVLKFPQGSRRSSYAQLYVAFLISGIIHTISYPPRFALAFDHRALFFFCSQALAITAEDVVTAALERYAGKKQPGTLARLVGYVWTYSWFVYSIPAWADSTIGEGGGAKDRLPFSIVQLFFVPLILCGALEMMVSTTYTIDADVDGWKTGESTMMSGSRAAIATGKGVQEAYALPKANSAGMLT